MFELLGFNKIGFHLFSLLLLAGSSFVMAVSLSKVFPNNHAFVSFSMLFAFFLPTVSCLTFLVFTDNSRLSLLMFWSSVLVFQIWTERPGSYWRLVLAVFIYILSFLTYEASSFLIFVVPFFCLPIYRRRIDQSADWRFYFGLSLGIFGGFAAALAIRFLFLSGGAVEHVSILPSLELFVAYLALLPFYIIEPFVSIPSDPWAWVMGAGVVVCSAVLVFLFTRPDTKNGSEDALHPPGEILYAALLGLMILLLGMLPYQLAGYGLGPPGLMDTALAKWGIAKSAHPNSFNFNEASRLYSSASCGLAILFAALLSAWTGKRATLVAKIAAVAVLGFMAMFHTGLRTDWKEAAAIRNSLVASLVNQVPEVKPKTNFVFLNLELYHKRASVIRGWGGLRALIRMLYHDRTLGAWYLYPSASKWPNSSFQQAIVLREGFVSRGIELNNPAPHDSLLLFNRCGSNLVLLDKITVSGGLVGTGISWQDAESLRSNPDRIMGWGDISTIPGRPDRNAWTADSSRLKGPAD